MRVDIKKIIDLRMKLHRMPELAFEEKRTSLELKKFFTKLKPSRIVEIGKTSFVAVFDSGKKGETIAFRAELDALPIKEPTEILNRSLNDGVSHKCGHDGHMAIMTGLAEAISFDRPKKGKVVFLFQAAEENLQGAREIVESKEFKDLQVDYIFAIHNLPGFERDAIILKDGNITCATNGVTINLLGTPSHASYPEKAVNPTFATVKLLQYLHKDIYNADYKDFVLSTPVYTKIGTPNFGITPAESQIMVTLRAYEYADLDRLIGLVQDSTTQVAKKNNLKYKISYSDDAPPIFNDKFLTNIVKQTAKEQNIKIIKLHKPFRWADDFGYYTIKYKACYFGIGMGNIPELHDDMYDFDDNRLLPSIKFLYQVYKQFYN